MTAITTVLFLFVSVIHWSSVKGLPSGPPAQACGDLSPLARAHRDSVGQSTAVPYEVDLSSLADGSGGFSYMAGMTYPCMYNNDNTCIIILS